MLWIHSHQFRNIKFEKFAVGRYSVTFVIAIVFGVIYKLWAPLYEALSMFGLQLDQLIYGMWFIAATVAFLIIRKPGVALIAEIGPLPPNL